MICFENLTKGQSIWFDTRYESKIDCFLTYDKNDDNDSFDMKEEITNYIHLLFNWTTLNWIFIFSSNVYKCNHREHLKHFDMTQNLTKLISCLNYSNLLEKHAFTYSISTARIDFFSTSQSLFVSIYFFLFSSQSILHKVLVTLSKSIFFARYLSQGSCKKYIVRKKKKKE